MSLDNELLRQDQRTANAFTGSSYDDVLDFYEERGANRSNPDDFNTYQEEQAIAGLTQNEDGTYSNDEGERVYVYRDSAELGDDSGGLVGQPLVMRTEAEIREAWEADEGMGYFKEANPQMDVDTYMEFIAEKDSMYASGVLDLNPHDDVYNTGHKGRGPNADAINAVLAEEKSRVQAAEAQANATLNDKYGVQTSFTNDDGDRFEFNGATYTKTHKVDDHLGVGDYVKMGAGVLMSVYAGPLLASSLGSVMGPAMAKAASSAIISQATAFMNGQDLSIGDALQSAAMSYGGAKLGDMFSSGGELSGTVSEITDKVTSATDKFTEFVTQGNSIAEAALKAGGMSMLTSLVTTGEVDLEAAGLAAVMAGGAEGLGQLGNSLTEAGATPEEVDEFMADLSESEEFQQAAMDADIKDPFLNPNYTTVGDGLMTNSAGDIFNYAGDAIGNMSDLDLDGDGMLSGNDLQNITTNNTPVDLNTNGSSEATDDGMYYDQHGNAYAENPYTKDGARVYLDSEGNVYTQDQLGGFVDGSAYGDIYMVDGQEVLLEQGTMINGRMMFDGDGDGRFDVVYNENGRVVAQYDPEIKDWVDHNGNTSASIGKYMNSIDPLTGASGSGIENPFNMSKEAYEAMTGEQYVDDLFALKATAGGTGEDGMLLALEDGEMAQIVARFEKSPYTDPNTGEVLSGAEGLERYLKNKRVGVNYSSEHGWRLETGIDTSDGIYGTMNDNHSVADFEGAPDTTEDSELKTIADIKPNAPIDDDPFTDPVEPEPIEPEEVIKEIEEKYTKEESSDPGGEDGADNTQPIDTSGSNSNDSANSTSDSASSSSSSADAAALAAAYAAAGKPNPHEGTGGPLDPVANPVETSDLPADTTKDSDDSEIEPTDGTGDPVPPTTNSRIEEMMATGATYEEAVANQNAAIQAGADANSDGMVTNEEWSLFSGNSATGDSDSQDASDTTDQSGGNGTSEDVTTGTGENDDSTVGSGTEADNTGNTGTGTTGDTGDVSQGTNPDGSVAGPGPNNGPGTEGPGGPGDGAGGGGNGDGGGMMSGGGDYTPQWGELFAYTTLTPYQKKALAPHVDYIKKGRGMLS